MDTGHPAILDPTNNIYDAARREGAQIYLHAAAAT
jgi:hypothetical protein